MVAEASMRRGAVLGQRVPSPQGTQHSPGPGLAAVTVTHTGRASWPSPRAEGNRNAAKVQRSCRDTGHLKGRCCLESHGQNHNLRRVVSVVLLGVTSITQSIPHMGVPMASVVHPSAAPSSFCQLHHACIKPGTAQQEQAPSSRRICLGHHIHTKKFSYCPF